MPDYTDIVNKKFTTSSGKDVKDTQMLKGEAKDGLKGTNVTTPDVRSGGVSGKTGGKPGY
jgi:hypothetical protein